MAEYGSARIAAQQFCRDADRTQIHELRREWNQFRTRQISLDDINHNLHQLGCAWLFHTTEEFEQMLDAIPGARAVPGGKK
jgi:hypothetical protein